MRTTLDLPDSILADAKKAAAGRKTTLRALIIESLQMNLYHKRTKFELRDQSFGDPGSSTPAEVEEEVVSEPPAQSSEKPFWL